MFVKKNLLEKSNFNDKKIPLDITNFTIVSLNFNNKKLGIKVFLTKSNDKFNFLQDDNQYGIIEIIYKNFKIKNFNYDSFLSFRGSKILSFTINSDGNLFVSFGNNIDGSLKSSSFELSFTEQRWTLVDIITNDEYEKFINDCISQQKKINDSKKIILPSWLNLTNDKEFVLNKNDKFYSVNKLMHKNKLYTVHPNFHDTELFNLAITNGNFHAKLEHLYYLDEYDLLMDDRHRLIYECLYKDIEIVEMSLFGPLCFYNCDILAFEDIIEGNDKLISVYFLNDLSNFTASLAIKFKYKDYLWKAQQIIDISEYDKFSKCADKFHYCFKDSHFYEEPDWAKLTLNLDD